MKKIFYNKKLAPLLFILTASISTANAAIPTFDYSNLLTAIDSTMKAVEFYNSTLSQMQEYARTLENLSTAINAGDFDEIVANIKDIIAIIDDISKEIEEISKEIENRRREAEIADKKATLEIIDILTKPSIDGIKGYIDKYDEEYNSIELIKSIASDTKSALELMFTDYSETADEAIAQLENKYITAARKLSGSLNDLKESQSNYSSSMTAQQTLSAFLTELSAINRTLDNTKEGIDILKKDVKEGKKDIAESVENWKNILEKLEKAQGKSEELKKGANNFVNLIDRLK